MGFCCRAVFYLNAKTMSDLLGIFLSITLSITTKIFDNYLIINNITHGRLTSQAEGRGFESRLPLNKV